VKFQGIGGGVLSAFMSVCGGRFNALVFLAGFHAARKPLVSNSRKPMRVPLYAEKALWGGFAYFLNTLFSLPQCLF